ncbi:MAG TPA: amidohydrolase family protein, partial [Anaerolineaceae bacterium]|nr:amidohydrolase family protein [Anaerolineaceae bacterium]
LAAYTTGAAYAGGLEDRLGRLVPGYKADLIVLPEDPFQLPPDRLYDLRPEATMVAGEWVWRSR